MEITILNLKQLQQRRAITRYAEHTSAQRTSPSLWQYDYLVLKTLATDVATMLNRARHLQQKNSALQALDIGCNTSPYRRQLEKLGFSVKTMDLDIKGGADLEGTVENTGLPDNHMDLIICTQVLEHCPEPWKAAPELFRVLRPGGMMLASAPHAWFYHPHPSDNWRYTPEGLVRLMNAAGFEIESVMLQGGSVLAMFQVMNFCLFGVFGKVGAPIFLLLNMLGALLDRIFPNILFPINVAILVRKPRA